ncbi:hypothetical protein LZ31DRAFT_158539 [Colletotrichum somersetense]|nr:hypothetical protein LZ31DRAFT_158539 [Colletotrichum somersetense]
MPTLPRVTPIINSCWSWKQAGMPASLHEGPRLISRKCMDAEPRCSLLLVRTAVGRVLDLGRQTREDINPTKVDRERQGNNRLVRLRRPQYSIVAELCLVRVATERLSAACAVQIFSFLHRGNLPSTVVREIYRYTKSSYLYLLRPKAVVDMCLPDSVTLNDVDPGCCTYMLMWMNTLPT